MNLSNEFSRDSFLNFVAGFFPSFNKDIRPIHHNKYFKETHSLGANSELDLQVIELVIDGSLVKRVSITTEAFKLMKSIGSYKALVVFRSLDEEAWRLSLMTAIPTIEKGKVVTKLSNPRRFSYFLGPSAKTVTPYNYLIKKGKVVDFEDLQKRFSIEVVNKEFFESIAELYTKLVGGKRKKGQKMTEHSGILKIASKKSGSSEHQEFAVRLIGRIVFCWFLREKKSANGTPLIPDEVFSLGAVNSNQMYYHQTLEPLFFEILNKKVDKRRDPFKEKPFSLIPYLNGGLFSPHRDDYYIYSEETQCGRLGLVDVPDKWLKEFIKLLDTYNFTVDENTTYDIDLSVDPEMLGRIFENLLAEINPETGESARKSTGSFYTPRPIVEYMVDKSLVYHIKSKTGIGTEKIEALVSYDLLDNEDNSLNKEEKVKIIDALSELTVLDPACGSGAFPIGILQKVVFILQQIDRDAKIWLEKQLSQVSPELRRHLKSQYEHKNYDYLRKLGIIRESIYGVDIQPVATEIARLRCFLTLIVEEKVDDEEYNRGIEPLPNLDFKFVTANTLLKLDILANKVENQGNLFEDHQGIDELKEIRENYFGSHNAEREFLKNRFLQVQSRMLQNNINSRQSLAKTTQKLSTWDPFRHGVTDWFDSEWMFGIKNGFDIIIANPPYGILNKRQNRAESIVVSNKELELYKKSDYYKPASGGMINIFRLFILRSIHLLKEDGFFSEIFPLAFTADLSASRLRKYVLDNTDIVSIDAFPERDNQNKRVFEPVKMSVCIMNLKKSKKNPPFFIRINSDRFIDNNAEKNYLTKEVVKKLDPINYTFPLASAKEIDLLTKVFLKSKRFKEIGKCNTGEIDMTFCKQFFTNNPENASLLKGAIIDRYQLKTEMSQGEIVFIDEKKLLSSKKNLSSDFKNKERIVLQGITGVNEPQRIKMMMINNAYCANSLNYLTINCDFDLKYLLGIFNSKLLNFIFSKFSTNSNVNGYEIDNLPIPLNVSTEKMKIIDNVNKILESKKKAPNADTSEYEKQIDDLVYKLYDLTPEEIKIVEGK